MDETSLEEQVQAELRRLSEKYAPPWNDARNSEDREEAGSWRTSTSAPSPSP